MERRSFWLAVLLGILVLGTIGLGLFFRHYFLVLAFAVWLCIEFAVLRSPVLSRLRSRPLPVTVPRAAELVALYEDLPENLSILSERLAEERVSPQLDEYGRRWLERLNALSELRAAALLPLGQGRFRLRQLLAFAVSSPVAGSSPMTEPASPDSAWALQDVTESATRMAALYWRLMDACQGHCSELERLARGLYEELFGVPFDSEESRSLIESLTDLMQRDGGVPFLLFNSLRRRDWGASRSVAMRLATGELGGEMDEETRTSLYWIAETLWFDEAEEAIVDSFETAVRHLYHLCFTNPDRAGFLEIGGQFFSQFGTVNELAREGFLFKEILVEKILRLWSAYPRWADPIFQRTLEVLTGTHNKIYDDLETWSRFWERERERFCREYLFLVEGNLCFSSGHDDDARLCYERALEASPGLRPALLNLLFVTARQADAEAHARALDALIGQSAGELPPSTLASVAESYLLLGDSARAEELYTDLERSHRWESGKKEHRMAVFCLEHGLSEVALRYAERAVQLTPSDLSVRYHASLCYRAVGRNDDALELLTKIAGNPPWLDYYKFTLQRDAGRFSDASETLKSLPTDYFQDPEELDAALHFAKARQDLELLRHLKRKS